LHRFELPHVATPQGLSVSADGRYAAAGSWRGFVYLFRLKEEKPVRGEKVSPVGLRRKAISRSDLLKQPW
jgi:hypothetical protein